MFFKLLTTVILCIGVAGVIIGLNKIFKNRLPKWLLPVALASAIIGYHIFDDYNWHSRKVKGLEQAQGEFVIVGEYRSRGFLRPWSYIKAPITRLDAVNVANNKPIPELTGSFENYMGTSNHIGGVTTSLFIFDCVNSRFAPKVDNLSDMPWGAMSTMMVEGLCQ